MSSKYYLAIDIGASSGRHIVGWQDGSDIKTKEVYRFENHVDKVDDHLVWDTERLFAEIKRGIKVAFSIYKHIESLAIDTWGVDYVLLSGDSAILPCYAYRDNRTEAIASNINAKLSFEYLYGRTGIQFQPFNTLYQLCGDKENGRLKGATDFLMLPEYFNFLLTGSKIKEYTNATTTGLISAETNKFDTDLIRRLDLPLHLFPDVHQAGTTVGELLPEIAAEVEGQTKVKLCASHDTASAFEAVDNEDNSVLISSGTWSLVGAKIKEPLTSDAALRNNFTNEGGVGYIRFLKNVTGMWISVQLHNQYEKDFVEMAELALHSSYDGLFDVNDGVFSAPENMSEVIKTWFLSRDMTPPGTEADYYRTAYRSLAYAYKIAIEQIEESTNTRYDIIYIVGGGAKNAAVNKFTKDFTEKTVIPVPIEATAIGNLKCQMR